MTLKQFFCAVAVIAVFCFAFSIEYRERSRSLIEGRQLKVALAVCNYVDANNSWPKNWDMLQKHFGALTKEEFVAIRRSVELRFDFDVKNLYAIAIDSEKSRGFSAIKPRRNAMSIREIDPNKLILDHFRSAISF